MPWMSIDAAPPKLAVSVTVSIDPTPRDAHRHAHGGEADRSDNCSTPPASNHARVSVQVTWPTIERRPSEATASAPADFEIEALPRSRWENRRCPAPS